MNKDVSQMLLPIISRVRENKCIAYSNYIKWNINGSKSYINYFYFYYKKDILI